MTTRSEKTLATGAMLDAATWADFVTRLRHHSVGEGVREHYTSNALFVVQRLTYTYGIERDYHPERVTICDDCVWVNPQHYWDDTDQDRRDKLDATSMKEHGLVFMAVDTDRQFDMLDELPDHRVVGRSERWDFVSAHLTREAADAFIQRKWHDYRYGLRVYVAAQRYAWEFEAIKAGILNGSITFNPPPEKPDR